MASFLKRSLLPLYHKLSEISSLQKRADRLVWGSRFRRFCQTNPCPLFGSRPGLYESLFVTEKLDGPIDYQEFGVWEGESIRWWVERNRDAGSTFTGFDSFEGLPENWDGMPEGSFSTKGKIPDIADPRCQFVKGWFQDTFPPWLKDREVTGRLVINLDADLYGSSLLVLVQSLPRMKAGDILIFDEFYSYMHEFRAFVDGLSACDRKFQALGHTENWGQLVLKVV